MTKSIKGVIIGLLIITGGLAITKDIRAAVAPPIEEVITKDKPLKRLTRKSVIRRMLPPNIQNLKLLTTDRRANHIWFTYIWGLGCFKGVYSLNKNEITAIVMTYCGTLDKGE